MSKRIAPRKNKNQFSIYITFVLMLSIPLVVLGIVKGSFDIRNRAFDDVTVSESNPCVISLPNVNPYTLEVGKTITVQVDATLTDANIASLSITDSSGKSIYQESFDGSPFSIATNFKFTPTKSGIVDMLGLITKVGGGSVACTISSAYDVLGLKATTTNQAPTFTSLVSSSKPSQNITTDVTYEYTLTASDPDGDRINYHYSFTPNADWLKPTIIEDGSNGKLTIKFQGSTSKPASYLANVFIHDGYSKHLSSQTWVISVSPSSNDIPVVKVITPLTSQILNQGDSFKTTWEGSDLNQITKYSLYMSKNPTDKTSWITVNENVAYNVNSYMIDTSKLTAGTYKLIVQATDNQNPALSGLGVSPEIVISGNAEKPEDDVVVLADPQVINMTPTSTDTISNKQVTVKATLIAGTNAKIDDKSITMKLDDKDITTSISINKISDKEHTVIYQPDQNFTSGLHKAEIYFKDSNGKTVTKSWTFTITEENVTPTGYIHIFGMDVSQRTLIIVGIAIIVIALAIIIPIVLSSVWKEDKAQKDEDNAEGNTLPNIPSEPIPFTPVTQSPEITELVETPTEDVTPVEDVWDSYSAPVPQAQTIQTPIPPEENVRTIPAENITSVPEQPVITAEPQPMSTSNTEPVAQAEQIPVTSTPETEVPSEKVSPAPVQEPIPAEVPQEPAAPVQPASSPIETVPPEPDLSSDLSVSNDLSAIFDQIQQTNQEETKPSDTNPTNS